MALANQSKIADAQHELEEMQTLMTDTNLLIPLTPFSAAIDGAVVASKLLSGTIALKEKKINDAIIDFSEAVMLNKTWCITSRGTGCLIQNIISAMLSWQMAMDLMLKKLLMQI